MEEERKGTPVRKVEEGCLHALGWTSEGGFEDRERRGYERRRQKVVGSIPEREERKEKLSACFGTSTPRRYSIVVFRT